MTRAKLALGALALGLTGLLAACGPGNTLAVGKGSEDFRLKTVEANLQKVQEDVKTLASHQQQNDGRLVEVHKKLAELVSTLEAQGVKVPAGASKGSALGVGFAHPEAAAAPAAPAAAPAAAAPSPWDNREAGPTPPAAAPAASQPTAAAVPAGRGTGPSPGMPGGLPPAPMPHGAGRLAQPPAAEPRARQPMGRVGPAESPAPATPEAVIAADRKEATPPISPGSPGSTGPKVAAGPAPVATPPSAPAPAPAPVESPPAAKTDEASSTAKPASPVPGNAETATPAQKAEYNKALQLAINGRTAEAKAAFDQFLTANPNSPLTPNALYWVGEGAFARGEYQTAITDFEKVAKGWPGHHKAADSLYKMAMAQEKAGDTPAARASLERYLADYPNAELAGMARQKLQALPK